MIHFLILLITLLAFPAFAVELTPQQREQVARVENYLNSLGNVQARFTQVAPSGELTGGQFYMQRPGRMRWEYDPPTPILMIADGNQLIYYDSELEQVSHVPQDSTLAGFLARKNIRLKDDVTVTRISEGAGVMRISLVQTEKPDEGKLTLEFATQPEMQLRQMLVVDATGQETTIALDNARFGGTLDASLFKFVDTRQSKKKIIR